MSGPRWMVRSSGGSPVNAGPSRNTIDSRTASSLPNCSTVSSAPDGRTSSRSSVMHSQRHSATRHLAVSRLDDLSRFPDSPLPDVSVGVSQRALRGVQARGHRRPALNRDRGAPALVEVPDREHAVLVGGLAERVLDLLEELGQPGRCDGRHCLPQRAECQRGHRNQRLITWYMLSRHPQRLLSPSKRITAPSVTRPGKGPLTDRSPEATAQPGPETGDLPGGANPRCRHRMLRRIGGEVVGAGTRPQVRVRIGDICKTVGSAYASSNLAPATRRMPRSDLVSVSLRLRIKGAVSQTVG